MKNKNPNTQIPESQVKLRPGAVVAKETERESVWAVLWKQSICSCSRLASSWRQTDPAQSRYSLSYHLSMLIQVQLFDCSAKQLNLLLYQPHGSIMSCCHAGIEKLSRAMFWQHCAVGCCYLLWLQSHFHDFSEVSEMGHPVYNFSISVLPTRLCHIIS